MYLYTYEYSFKLTIGMDVLHYIHIYISGFSRICVCVCKNVCGVGVSILCVNPG